MRSNSCNFSGLYLWYIDSIKRCQWSSPWLLLPLSPSTGPMGSAPAGAGAGATGGGGPEGGTQAPGVAAPLHRECPAGSRHSSPRALPPLPLQAPQAPPACWRSGSSGKCGRVAIGTGGAAGGAPPSTTAGGKASGGGCSNNEGSNGRSAANPPWEGGASSWAEGSWHPPPPPPPPPGRPTGMALTPVVGSSCLLRSVSRPPLQPAASVERRSPLDESRHGCRLSSHWPPLPLPPPRLLSSWWRARSSQPRFQPRSPLSPQLFLSPPRGGDPSRSQMDFRLFLR
mmetsp:Transcript_148773/g.386831  ORF Transcript_148773/g.386831 Transcript_148773/m.386831 type:complete len:284 (-) Transcript_148773:401-1252(-)